MNVATEFAVFFIFPPEIGLQLLKILFMLRFF